MIARDHGPLRRYEFTSLGQGIVHGVYTRLGGHSEGAFASLNVGGHVGDEPDRVAANHTAIYRDLRIDARDVVSARQVHGDRAAAVSTDHGGHVLPETDALISNAPSLFLLLRFADCVPVFLHAPHERAVGMVHAGWQGTLAWIAAKAARAMVETYGCRPDEIRAGLGPAIGPCCFEVGPEVVAAVRESFGASADEILDPREAGKACLDLWRANALQLREVGLTRIETTDLCTCCRRDLFFPHRGENGHTGRFATVIGLAGSAGN